MIEYPTDDKIIDWAVDVTSHHQSEPHHLDERREARDKMQLDKISSRRFSSSPDSSLVDILDETTSSAQ